MIEQQARVLRVGQLAALVQIGAQSGCLVCDSGKGCGAGIFGKLLKRKPIELELLHTTNLSAGQAVILGIPESLFIRLVVRLYGLPLIAGLLGAAIAHRWAAAADLTSGRIDLLAVCGGLFAAAIVLKIWSVGSKPDISAADIRLVVTKRENPACDMTVPSHKTSGK